MSRVVEVVAAVIERPDGEFLLAQRPEGKVYAGYWEFPGGKVEPGESFVDAVARELREELGIEVQRAHPWITRIHDYPHGIVKLHFHRVTQWRGEPQPHEGQSLAWQRFPHLSVSPMLPANGPVLKSLRIPTSMGITRAREAGIDASIEQVRAARDAGLRMIQVREKDVDPTSRRRFAERVRDEMRGVGGIVVINGDLPLAQSLGAGLHMTSQELMRAALRPEIEWCGASCHDPAQLNRARELGLDYIVLGPVASTPSHPGLPELGWARFAELVYGYPLPVFALGGMRAADLPVARDHGAHGVAMIRGAWGAC